MIKIRAWYYQSGKLNTALHFHFTSWSGILISNSWQYTFWIHKCQVNVYSESVGCQTEQLCTQTSKAIVHNKGVKSLIAIKTEGVVWLVFCLSFTPLASFQLSIGQTNLFWSNINNGPLISRSAKSSHFFHINNQCENHATFWGI